MGIILLLFFLLLVLSLIFQIRDWIYMSKYQKPLNPEIGCSYKCTITSEQGYTKAECRNKYYDKKFKNQKCPENCAGRRYPGTPENYEMMSSTDRLYIAKKLICFAGTLWGTVLTFLNIMDKIN